MFVGKRIFCQAIIFCALFNTQIAFSANKPTVENPTQKNRFSLPSLFPSSLKTGHPVFQLGWYLSHAGKAQHINIEDLIGNDYTVTKHSSDNGLVGLGYYIDGQNYEHFKLNYGINAFFLANTRVTGNVIQESLFTNLSYRYKLSHYPIYAVAKSIIKTKWSQYDATLDVGIGPNFMQAYGLKQTPLDPTIVPDTIFSSHTTTTFAATAGAGIKINHFFGEFPLECGYRFFYLGEGHFNKATNQVINTLKTGSVYANALICSISI